MGSSHVTAVRSRPHPLWGNRVDSAFKVDLDGLFEAGDAVEALQLEAGWAHVQVLLEAEIRHIEAKLEDGLLPTRSDYAFLHGRLSGLKAVALAADAIVSRASQRLWEQHAKHEAGGEPSGEA